MVNCKFQYAVSDGLADIKGFLVAGNADAVGIIEIVRDLDPITRARSKVENSARDSCRQVLVWPENRRISAAVRGHDDIVDTAVEFPSLVVSIPTAHLL